VPQSSVAQHIMHVGRDTVQSWTPLNAVVTAAGIIPITVTEMHSTHQSSAMLCQACCNSSCGSAESCGHLLGIMHC